jgi:hypothetical protein
LAVLIERNWTVSVNRKRHGQGFERAAIVVDRFGRLQPEALVLKEQVMCH